MRDVWVISKTLSAAMVDIEERKIDGPNNGMDISPSYSVALPPNLMFDVRTLQLRRLRPGRVELSDVCLICQGPPPQHSGIGGAFLGFYLALETSSYRSLITEFSPKTAMLTITVVTVRAATPLYLATTPELTAQPRTSVSTLTRPDGESLRFAARWIRKKS
jgi:hypothetical protein